jgi:protein-tyrosine phosphatase
MKVLVVCTGNICRSPSGEAVLRKKAAERGLHNTFNCTSAGTHAYHVGSPPDDRSIRVGVQRGYDLSEIRAQKISLNNFFDCNIFLAMDTEHLRILQRLKPVDSKSKILLFLEYSLRFRQQDVPDPYYGSMEGFNTVLEMIEEGADTFLNTMYPPTTLSVTES